MINKCFVLFFKIKYISVNAYSISSLTDNSGFPRNLGAAGLALIGLADGGRREVFGLAFDSEALKASNSFK